MIIARAADTTLRRLAKGFPVVALVGPRQSGKTTLARAVFAGKPYVSLEDPDERSFAQADPRAFLRRFRERGAVIDEAQRCPELFSYLQGWVDERRRMGDIVLTGSHGALMGGKADNVLAKVDVARGVAMANASDGATEVG